jgi:hypothetical protein
MYDSLKSWTDRDLFSDSGHLHRVPTLLTDISEIKRDNGFYSISGNLENLRVSVNPLGVSISGSLNKFWHNDNFQKLTRQQTELCMEKLSDILQIDFSQSSIKKLDIAHNFIMNESPESYYSFLGDCTHYNRMVQPNSIYYCNKLKTKLFYNKALEGKAKKMELPAIWQNKNILRYEFRLLKRIAAQMNMTAIQAKDLYSESFYMALIDKMIDEYNQIRKNKILTPKIDNMTCKNAKEFLLSALVEMYGINQTTEIIQNWNDKFSTKKEAQRFKRKLNNLKGLTEASQLITELDKKIMRIKEHYR